MHERVVIVALWMVFWEAIMKRGMRVEFERRKADPEYGYVTKVSAGKLTVVMDNGQGIKGSVNLFRPSERPPSVDSPFADPYFAVGARVEIDEDSRVLVGSVIKEKTPFITVAFDGGAFEPVELLKSEVRKNASVAPKDDPSPMDKWSIRAYVADRRRSEETEAFSADILLDGKKVLVASNGGTGGCNLYRGDGAIEQRLEMDARAWARQFGCELKYEAADIWVTWAGTLKPKGQLAKDFLPQLAEDLNLTASAPSP